MIFAAWVLLGILALRTAVALVNAFSPRGLADKNPAGQPLISVLIPARNEEDNLPFLLADLALQDYPRLEILVFDDESTDGTRSAAERAFSRDSRLRLLGPEPLPQGWLGKSHACDALARKAAGELFVFLDADVRLSPRAISRAVARFEAEPLFLLSLFPRQTTVTWGERAVVPVMNWALLCLLPLVLVRRTKSPALAAANGQFLVFEAAAYRRHEPHSQIRSNPADDIALARWAKAQGLPVEVRMAGDEVRCRMYTGGRAALQGFARNVADWVGGSPAVLAGFLVTIVAAPVLAALAWGGLGLGAWTLLAVILQGAVAVASGEPVWAGVIWAPVRAAAFFVLVLGTLWGRLLGRAVLWKGRSVTLSKKNAD